VMRGPIRSGIIQAQVGISVKCGPLQARAGTLALPPPNKAAVLLIEVGPRVQNGVFSGRRDQELCADPWGEPFRSRCSGLASRVEGSC
jgi:hypothetical protein